MSQSAAARPVRHARPAATPSRPTAPRLRVVSAPVGARSRAGLVVLCVSLLALGLVALLVLNMQLQQGAYSLRELGTDAVRLTEARQQLQEDLAKSQAPQTLAERAQGLGMVPDPNIAFVRGDGQVVGRPEPARRPAPTAEPTGEPASPSRTAGPAESASSGARSPSGEPSPSASGTR